MKKVLFVIIFVLLLFSECLSKKYSKKNKTKQLKNPPPYVNKYSNEIAVYVNRGNHPVVNAILYHISVRTCLNFNLVHKKIKYKSGINIYETSKHNSLKMSYSKRKPTILKLKKYALTNRARLAVYIGRALGMIPEISRPDRDEFVQIHWRNIKKSHRHYYRKAKNNYSYYPGVEFDFGSIMLVNPLFGSKNKRKPTYTFKINSGFHKIYDPFHVLSHNDFKFINGMYCRKKCKENYCKNGGFPGKNCKCICPFHFEGEKCESLKNSHGDCFEKKVYTATNKLQVFQYKGKTGKCNYHFKSNSNRNITISFTNILLPNSRCTRSDSYIDISYRHDRGTTGVTICRSMQTLMIPPISSEVFIYIHALKPDDSMSINYSNYKSSK